MAKPATNIHIPLTESEAVSLLLRVKPTKDMPRPGASKIKPMPKPSKKQKQEKAQTRRKSKSTH